MNQGGRIDDAVKITLTDTVPAKRFMLQAGTVCGDGARANGVSFEKGGGVATDEIDMQIAGRAVVESGDVVTVGGPVSSDADGKAVDKDTLDVVLGHALNAAVGAGEDVVVNMWAK